MNAEQSTGMERSAPRAAPPVPDWASRRQRRWTHRAVARFAPTLRAEVEYLCRSAKAPRLRTMREFAEEEIILPPGGDYAGRRFRVETQPYVGLWFDAVDSGRWTTHVATGPTQSGKTLSCFVIPILYHLFEVGEPVVCGLPNLQMASEKWGNDLRPVIEASRYAALLPRTGDGSRDGARVDLIRFRNGAVLKFMGAGGGDKQRAHFTTRVVVITEAEAFAALGESSYEADKIEQLLGRLRSFTAERRRVYMECTVTTELGVIWKRYQAGTASRIALPCPHCYAWVTPGRENLAGWQDAADELAAREGARWHCPACGEAWSEDERRAANLRGVLVHRGQTIRTLNAGKTWPPRFELTGDAPRTMTLGFRWDPWNNLFLSAADIGEDEWRAARDPDEESTHRKLCQFVWAIPTKPGAVELTPLDAKVLAQRFGETPRGLVPAEAEYVTIHIDLGKWLAHYVVLASRADARSHVVEYGRFDVPSDDFAPDQAVLVALRSFRERVLAGWARAAGGRPRVPDVVWIDARWQGQAGSDPVYLFVRESNAQAGRKLFWPALGYGQGQAQTRTYHEPRRAAGAVKKLGLRYYVSWSEEHKLYLIHVDGDFWKAQLHAGLAAPADAAGAVTLYVAPAKEHTAFVKHLTAERQVTDFVPGRGEVTKWVRESRQNHWLDAAYNALAAAHFCGARLVQPEKTPAAPAPPRTPADGGRRAIRRMYG